MNIMILRHAETLHNRADAVQGHTDTEVSIKGEQQAEALGDAVRERFDVDTIYTSDLERATRTAKLLNLDAPIYADARLREVDFGEVSDIPLADFIEENPRYRTDHPDAAYQRFPNGESLADVYTRVVEFLEEIAVAHDPDDTVLIVGHHTTVTTSHTFATDSELEHAFDLDIDNCEGFLANVDDGEWEVEEYPLFADAT